MTDELRAAAEAAVVTAEGVGFGAAFAAPVANAERAVDAFEAPALAELFPVYTPAGADEIERFRFYEDLFTTSGYAEDLAGLHAVADPPFATFLRSAAVLARLRAAGARHAAALQRTAEDVGAEFVERYQRAVAAQLVGRPDVKPAASVLTVEGPRLRARLVACRERHEEHVIKETARVEREAREAEVELQKADTRRRSELAEWFTARAQQSFFIKGNTVSGQALAAIAKKSLGRDVHGADVVGITLDDLAAVAGAMK